MQNEVWVRELRRKTNALSVSIRTYVHILGMVPHIVGGERKLF